MDKIKLINLFLLAFLLSLGVQYFLGTNQPAKQIQWWLVLNIQKDQVVIPNIPVIEAKNTSTGDIIISPCQDISLTIESVPVMGIDKMAPDFCRELILMRESTTVLPMKELYPLFADPNYAGKYTLTLQSSLGERVILFEMEKPGSIRSLLSAVVYQPIYNLFVGLLTFLPEHSLWWAIIIVTLIIRIILLVPQHHMLEGQKKMQKIQPKIKALQKEFKDDQATLGMKMLELYKKEWVNPMGSILPLLIQMPILIGLYWVISEINDPSNFYHLYSFFRDFKPTEISTYFYGLHLNSVGGIIWIIFALVLGVIQYIQARLSFAYTQKKEEPKKETPEWETPDFALDPAVMQNMMLYFFPVVIAITSYFFPLGVGLYWFIGTIFVIGQQAYVNRKK